MRPANPRARAHRTGDRQVRALVGLRLGWTAGYPVGRTGEGVSWQCGPEHTEKLHLLDRGALHHATRAWYTIQRDHLSAAERSLEEGAAWCARVPELIELIKPAVHGEQDPPDDTLRAPSWSRREIARVQEARARHPALTPLLNRATWVWFLRPAALGRVLDGLDRVAPDLITFLGTLNDQLTRDRWAVRMLWLMSEHGPELVARTAAFLTVLQAFDVPDGLWRAGQLRAAMQATFGAHRSPMPDDHLPDPDLAAAVLSWLDGRIGASPEQLRRSLDLLRTVWPVATQRARHHWLARLRPLLARAHKRSSPLYDKPGADTEALAELERLALDEAAWSKLGPLLPAIDLVVQLPTPAWDHLQALLAMAGTHDDPRLPTLVLADVAHSVAVDPKRAAVVAGHLNRWLERAEQPLALLRAWLDDPFDTWICAHDGTPAALMSLQARRGGSVPVALQVWTGLATAGIDLSDEDVRYASLDIAERWTEADAALRVARALSDAGKLTTWFDPDAHRAARLLDPGGHAPMPLYEHFQAFSDSPSLILDLAKRGLPRLARAVRDPHLWPLFKRLAAPWVAVRKARQAGALLAEPALKTDWILLWPEPLHPVLRDLAQERPDAEQVALRAVRSRYRPSDSLHAERAWLLEHAEGHEERRVRLTGVERRLQAPPKDATLHWMQVRLDRAADRAVLQRVEREVARGWTPTCQQLLGIDPEQVPLPQPRRDSLLAALCALDAPYRRLAGELLRRRAGPGPWHLHDLPANAAWIAGWRGRGLNLDPWLEPTTVPCAAADDSPLLLGIELDPLEVFWMGSHFKTCLSVGDVNFFSVVTNLADANKAVLYARRADGAVAGRCLLAIDEVGRLLTFSPYAHDPDLGFDELVAGFAQDLARAMGTFLAPHGTVRSLVAPRWYDDGAHDLAGVPEVFAPEGPLVRDLGTLPVHAIDARLDEVLGPTWRQVALGMLVRLDVIKARPELIEHWLPHLIDASPHEPAWQAALIALHEHDRSDAVRRLLHARIDGYFAHDRWARATPAPDLMEAMVSTDPVRTLRGLRRWCEDDRHHVSWAWWRGRALEELRRTSAALELYRRVAAEPYPHSIEADLVQQAQAQLRALGG